MQPIVLKNRSLNGAHLEATFLPDIGMNMISYKKDDIQIIDQSTKAAFEERNAGLGALIGPHFHRRRAQCVPKIKDESLFPHIARVKAKGITDPFSHGIARYAPWKAHQEGNKVIAELSGKDSWNGIPLAELEGQDFKMTFSSTLEPEGLKLHLSVVSATDSVVGIHYYYHLQEGPSQVISRVQDTFLCNGENKPLLPSWQVDADKTLFFDLAEACDYTFYPYPNLSSGEILLKTAAYTLLTKYKAPSQENGWQLYHPEGASFVCIEPVSAKDPRHPNLTVSSLEIMLSIL